MKNTLSFLFILLLASCTSKERETYAHITQRRMDAAGMLMISYQFNTGERLIYDSIEVKNKVVPHDSVKVVYYPEHPEDSRLLIP